MRKSQKPKIVTLAQVYHVGELPKGTKGLTSKRKRFSYEGSGLSVSQVPMAWVQIAHLGGLHLYSLTRSDGRHGRFVDLTASNRDPFVNLAVELGLLKPVTRWRVQVSDEDDDEMSLDFDSEQEAEDNNDAGGPVEEIDEWTATKALGKIWRADFSVALPLGYSEHIAALYVAEQTLDVDGAWWDEKLDVYNLSAPRGVIFKSKLAEWAISEVDWEDYEQIHDY